ncbi:MAG: hypothetical protein BMS9Abin23_0387 [Thermodesulfobacteriota bacterium]|nr:MAG: hypothetical protein BMS9Abin23_0387 [Thermodesulfobacteriota bacterium]
MPSITKEVFIKAPPWEVFDLIADIEDFSRYSSYIKEIKKISPGVYRWKVEFFGLKLEWDSRIIESKRPVRLAWESIRGVFNAGSYDLKPADDGTEVTFKMQYRLHSGLIGVFTAHILDQLHSKVAWEVLTNIKNKLEA